MNQKDYKEIAGIMEVPIYLHTDHSKGWCEAIEDKAKELADYFEREDKDSIIDIRESFNKKQFLKDCGVK